MAKFCWKIHSCIFEVYVQKWLLQISKFDLVLLENVINHADDLGWLIWSFDFELVGFWCLSPVETVNLVRLRVIRSNNSFAWLINI